MRLTNHKIDGIKFQPAHYTGGEITPEIVILHDTAGRLDKGNSATYLASANTGKASVHFVIERDGTVTQLVPTNRRANHAGTSSYHGKKWCNGFSIGIEIVNPGRMEDAGKNARTWFGQLFSKSEYDIQKRSTKEHGSGLWMGYTEEQIAALLDLLAALFDGIDSLYDIRTHWYVSPGRKVDTNPLFPLDHIRARVLGREDPDDVLGDQLSEEVPGQELVQIEVPGSALNMRRWPSFNPNVIAAIPDETIVPVLREGTFEGRDWVKVLWNGREGWVVKSYTAPITYDPGYRRIS